MRTLMLPLAVLTALLALPRDGAAQDYRQLVVKQLEAASGPVREAGFRPDATVFDRNDVVGMLAGGTSSFVELNLTGGASYFVAGACDQDCTDMDLRLFSAESTTPLAEDTGEDDYPMLNFTAPKTGRYMLAVDMPGCHDEDRKAKMCYYGYRVFRK